MPLHNDVRSSNQVRGYEGRCIRALEPGSFVLRVSFKKPRFLFFATGQELGLYVDGRGRERAGLLTKSVNLGKRSSGDSLRCD